ALQAAIVRQVLRESPSDGASPLSSCGAVPERRCHAQPTAVSAATPTAPRRSQRATPEGGGLVGDSNSRYVLTVIVFSGSTGRGRRRRSVGAGIQRLMNAKVSDPHTGQVCTSWISSQSMHSRASCSCIESV